MYGVLESCSCTNIVIVMSAKKEEGKNKADYLYVYRRYSDVVFCTYNAHVADRLKIIDLIKLVVFWSAEKLVNVFLQTCIQ